MKGMEDVSFVRAFISLSRWVFLSVPVLSLSLVSTIDMRKEVRGVLRFCE